MTGVIYFYLKLIAQFQVHNRHTYASKEYIKNSNLMAWLQFALTICKIMRLIKVLRQIDIKFCL